ncbi:MAG: GH3 auxin-responsive promoter family protein [Dehalococcoidales bacterium]|jgi:hypothetical protein
MIKAIDLLRQGKHEELWQMCCGFLRLDMESFMDIQENLMLQQIELLNKSPLGNKIMRGVKPRTVAEFRQRVPLTSYKDYTPELLDKREDILPEKPLLWGHSAGRSGEYPCKWIPLTADYAWELSKALYGIGMISCASYWGDTSHIPETIKVLYSVARKPYISGVFADMLTKQSPIKYMPPLEETDTLSFEERIQKGFACAMADGLDYFFGLSLVLEKVGEKIRNGSGKIDIRPYLGSPKAMFRLARGKAKSMLAGRPMLPKDLWTIRGIIGSGIDSSVYKNKIKQLWGRSPLDLYSCTEGGVIAVQAWDYKNMTFIPNLNFLEFIPEDEQLKLQMDRTYIPKTLLLNEVKAGEAYEIIITSFHGGAMVRYRLGDMVRIESLHNNELGIATPQMSFERRVTDIIDFNVIRFTEKSIWQALEKSGIQYEDWFAYKIPGEQSLNLYIELKNGSRIKENELTATIYNSLTQGEDDFTSSATHEDLMDMVGFEINVNVLPEGTFAEYTAKRQAEGADLAHLKPPHINPPDKVLAMLAPAAEETIIVTKTGVRTSEKKGEETVPVA